MVEPRRICGSCRTPVPADAAFCTSCGAATPTSLVEAGGSDHGGGDFAAGLAVALADRYRLARELGRGGMAIVYLAEDLRHERQVAIKVLRPELAAAIGGDRFVREIKLAAKLNHHHILPLHDSGATAGFLYYVMPFVEGESLRDRLQRDRQLPIEQALDIAREVAGALDYAHEQGVIHRDIKPENILLSRGHALIADFGIAKAVSSTEGTNLTSTGTAIGTPLYMSPEQAAGDPQLDGRTDIYSLGCVLYEMLAGEPPFLAATAQALMAKHAIEARPSVRVVRDTVPQAVDRAMQRAMAKAPSDRFARSRDLAHALERASSPAAAGAESSASAVGQEPLLRPSFVGGVLGGVLGGAAAGASIGVQYVWPLDPRWGLDAGGKAWLAAQILVFATLAGGVLGAGIQLGSQRLARVAAGVGGEAIGSMVGGLVGGALTGLVFALAFAARPLPPVDVRVFLPSASLIPLMLVTGIFIFDYGGRLWHVLPPLIGGVLLTTTVAGLAVIAFPYDWFFERLLAGNTISPMMTAGGVMFGGAIGGLLGFQVGMTLLLDRRWRQIGPPSLGARAASPPARWQRLSLVIAVGAGCFLVLSLATGIPARRDEVDVQRVRVSESAMRLLREHVAYVNAGQYLAARGLVCQAFGVDQAIPWWGARLQSTIATVQVPLDCRLAQYAPVRDFGAVIDTLDRVLRRHGRDLATVRGVDIDGGLAAAGVATEASGDSTLHFAARLLRDTLVLAVLDRSITLTDSIASTLARTLRVERNDLFAPMPWPVAWRVTSVPDTVLTLEVVRQPLRDVLSEHFVIAPVRRFVFDAGAGEVRLTAAFVAAPWRTAMVELAATYGLSFDERVPGSGVVHVARTRVVKRDGIMEWLTR